MTDQRIIWNKWKTKILEGQQAIISLLSTISNTYTPAKKYIHRRAQHNAKVILLRYGIEFVNTPSGYIYSDLGAEWD